MIEPSPQPEPPLEPQAGPAPELSVVVVSYGSRADLERLLPTLFAQGLEVEVLVVDNRPGDGTTDWLRVAYPSIRVIPRPDNPGYAGGNNTGITAARGHYILILNPDTELHPKALKTLLEAIQTHPQALIGAKLLNPDGTVNAAGNQMHYSGITTCRGLNQPAERYRGLEPVPLLSGAALIATKETLLGLGGFDEDYWMYLEDTDLSLRARLRGHPLFCANDALITHHYRLGDEPEEVLPPRAQPPPHPLQGLPGAHPAPDGPGPPPHRTRHLGVCPSQRPGVPGRALAGVRLAVPPPPADPAEAGRGAANPGHPG